MNNNTQGEARTQVISLLWMFRAERGLRGSRTCLVLEFRKLGFGDTNCPDGTQLVSITAETKSQAPGLQFCTLLIAFRDFHSHHLPYLLSISAAANHLGHCVSN